MIARACGWALALIVATGGCARSHERDPLDAPRVFLTEWLDALCTNAIRCDSRMGTIPMWPIVGPLEASFCHPVFRNERIAQYLDAVRAGEVTFDPEQANRCLAAYRAERGCLVYGVESDASDACANAFVGTVARGGVCSADWQCAGDAICAGDTCPRHCVPRLPEGASCAWLQCGRGLTCAGLTYHPDGTRSGIGRCAYAPHLPGDACTGTSCTADLPCVDGGCRRGRRGESCQDFECSPDLLCSAPWDPARPNYGVCGDGVPVGGACALPRDACAIGARCVDGTCETIAGPGETCDATHPCVYSFGCEHGTCTPLPPLGAHCTDGCLEGVCRDGTCSLSPDGEACSVPATIAVGECTGVCAASTDGYRCMEAPEPGGPCGPYLSCGPTLTCRIADDWHPRCLPTCSSPWYPSDGW